MSKKFAKSTPRKPGCRVTMQRSQACRFLTFILTLIAMTLTLTESSSYGGSVGNKGGLPEGLVERNGRKYPWGAEWSASRCNVHSLSDGFKSTAPVGSFEGGKSVYGCYDMSGNVWEWCADWFSKDYYSEMPYMNPKGSKTGKQRALRGGSWRDDVHYKQDVTRCAARVGCAPTYRADFIGFRCVKGG